MFVKGEKIRILGVSRGNEYSPNHVGNDAAIFRGVAEALEKKGMEVTVYPEKEFVSEQLEADFIFDMARDRATIQRLKLLEDRGALVINSAYGIDNCVRKAMTELLIANGVPHPKSFIIPSDGPFTPDIFPLLADFRKRGIPEAVVNEHLIGDLVKFYGVQETDFFYVFYPTEQSHSKFGLEAINGESRGYPFDAKLLQKYGNQAAEALNVPIYGGDCVVSKTGEIRIIDFNDWPSFARCREEAAPQIAECIYRRIMSKIENE